MTFLVGTPVQAPLRDKISQGYESINPVYLDFFIGCHLYYFDIASQTFQSGGVLQAVENNVAVLLPRFTRRTEQFGVPLVSAHFFGHRTSGQFLAMRRVEALESGARS